MLFNDAAVKIADALEEKGIAAPEEAGYELANDSGEVIAEIELAWINRKIGYMTEDQQADCEKADLYEHMGAGTGPDRVRVRKIPNEICEHAQIILHVEKICGTSRLEGYHSF